ncbi:CGNR zinc finger domain-containing protein [Mycolicibacterium pallens]|uniref:CGNR zinc finger domain-containing protein n=1 Tax=Mycolicibacterium pallens TaxID=370524 RepID=A0ABX8VV43_9MYCO|nr:CGNR zinc finger domain-containing protein [Mycolicibacterium pallens]QYL19519.1 CGNR zinc finger domain-containing protein [Mycolicibacterium pallens]
MEGELELRGGHIAVDFVNTVAWRGDSSRVVDHLQSYRDLVGWAIHAGVVDPAEARHLLTQCAESSAAASRALRDAKRIREALHSVWTVGATAAECDVISDAFARTARRRHLRECGGAVMWTERELTLHTPIDRIVVAAVDLWQSVTPEAIKACGDAACGWLFLDTSRRGNRRWCSTADCGNRARVRRHYERSRNPSGVATNT